MLEDAPVRLQAGAGQLRFDNGAVAGAAVAGPALFKAADQAMHVTDRLLLLPDGQHGGVVEQGGEVGIVSEAHQFDFQAIQLADALGQLERHDIKLNGFVGWGTEGKAHIIQVAHAYSCGSSHRAGS
nr:hypothetical protein [Pseudomonas sp. p21]